jgi:hypothetical protein
MSDIINQCGGAPATTEEILNSILVKRSSDGQYGLRAQTTNVASGAIVDGLACGTPLYSVEQILSMILNNSTIDGRLSLQFFDVTS